VRRWRGAESALLRSLAFVAACWFSGAACAADPAQVAQRRDADFAAGRPLIAHVVVALCDNVHQGIVPVPAALGDGANPGTNLYWGAMYGVRTFFKRSERWKSVPIAASQDSRVLERVAFRSEVERDGRRGAVFLVAEAWNGQYIADAIRHFLELNQGDHVEAWRVGDQQMEIGGAAHLVAFVGHNGLMDFPAPVLARSPKPAAARASVVLACVSDSYFIPLLGAESMPLLTTTGLMAPEAYTLEAAVTTWFSGQDAAEVRQAAGRAYARYQRSSEKAAVRLFRAPEAPASP
jgi:hypothetical protein